MTTNNFSIRFKAVTAAALITISFSACEKRVLDQPRPFNAVSAEDAFSSLPNIDLAVNGVYDAGQTGFYPGGQRGYAFGAASIQQGDMRGEDMHNMALFYQITYESTQNPVTANNVGMFNNLYALINRANVVSDGIRNAVRQNIVNQAAANEFEGEMRFLRALAHHELLLHFARPFTDGNGAQTGIIYRDFAINTPESIERSRALRRATVAANYTRLLQDLDTAELYLPVTRSSNRTFRATRAAAIAVKARVRMHMADWANVVTEGNKLISGTTTFSSPIGGWTLTPSPDGPFANNTSAESIFSMRNDPTDNPGVNGALAAMYGNPNIGGRGLVQVGPIIWSDPEWLCSDLRRSTLVNSSTVSNSVVPATDPTARQNIIFTNKYRDAANRSDAAPIIRYAEVLLMVAEAEARLAGAAVSPRGLALLNAVRNRAVTTPAQQFTIASFANGQALVAAILKERRIEFLAEGKRWGDIHRLATDPNFAPIPGGGIPSKVASGVNTLAWYNCNGAAITRAVPAIPYANFRFIWPIPQDETVNNPNYTQNPNY